MTPLDLAIATTVFATPPYRNFRSPEVSRPIGLQVGRYYDNRLSGFVLGQHVSLSHFATTALNGKRLCFRYGYLSSAHVLVWSCDPFHSTLAGAGMLSNDLDDLPHTRTWNITEMAQSQESRAP